MAEKEIVMNGAGVEELGFPMWPQFAPETLEDVLEPIKNGKVNYWTGPKGMEFEDMWAKWMGAKMAISCTNGTAALHIALASLGIGPGDEVIVPSYSFIASSFSVVQAGAIPVFADVTDDHTIDPACIEALITPRTKAIIVVHLYGTVADMGPVLEIAKKHNLKVVEDCAQCFGGEYKGKKLGSIGHFGSFSFHEVKNVTSFGEGGIVLTNVPGFAPEMKRARFLGLDFTCPIKDWLYNITAIPGKEKPFVASNYSTTEIQALGLKVQVDRNEEIIATRRRAAQYLTDRLAGNPAIIVQDMGNEDIVSTFHMYQIQIDPKLAGGNIQDLKAKLTEKGVTNIPHFGPLYRFKVIADMGYDVEEIAKSCPVCEDVFYNRFTHLPIYGLTKEQLDFMADAILESVKEMQEGK
jgi:dTDP-4-amino-4,6-dideoxygalactose transaminase